MKAPRTRRLLVGLAVAAVLVGAGRWMTKPRIDSRLLGEWEVHYAGGNESWPAPHLRFKRDGTATWWSSNIPNNKIYAPYRLRWSADENRLVWRNEYQSYLAALYGEYDRLHARFWDRATAAPQETECEILEVSAQKIELDFVRKDKSRHRGTLRRLE